MFKSECDLRVYVHREWVVLAPLEWQSASMHVIVQEGFITDLASIPRGLRNLFDINGPSRKAAVLHDWLYCCGQDAQGNSVTRKQADDLFREALAACGVGAIARNLYWSGVRTFGWMYWNKRAENPLNNEDDFVPMGYVMAQKLREAS